MTRPPPDIDPPTWPEINAELKRRRHVTHHKIINAAFWAVCGLCLGIVIGSALPARSEPLNPAGIYVIDGDTIRLPPQAGRSPVGQFNGGETVRILNIDAPETRACSSSPTGGSTRSCARCEMEAALGYKARERLATLLRGATITLDRCDGKRCTDPYGRTLARVFANGKDVGETLISEGLATRWPERFNGCSFRPTPQTRSNG
jgi:endonuclease YncB( thermonuclease family)